MAYFLLFLELICGQIQSICNKQYNLKAHRPNAFLYGGTLSFFALIFFVISGLGNLNFTMEFVPYSLLFALGYGSATFAGVMAIKTGPISLTSLLVNYSLLIPTLYGIIFLKEELSVFAYIGLAAFVISVLLVNRKNESMPLTPKWFLWIAIDFIGNGMCSTVQRVEQVDLNGQYKNEFMIVALAFVVAALITAGLIQERGNSIGTAMKDMLKYAPVHGAFNGAVNLLVMILGSLLPTSILFPSISGGGMVLTFFLATCIYHERLNRQQIIGYCIGIASLILLNL